MNIKFKLAAYALLLLLVAWFGWGFYRNYTISTRASAAAATNDTASVVTNVPVESTNPVSAPDSSTNAVVQKDGETSNSVPVPTNQEARAPASASSTNVAATAPVAAPPPAHAVEGTMIAYLAALVGAIIALGLLVAHDVTQIVGNAAVDALLDDKGEGLRDPDYEKAEEAWAAGKHLEAIQLLRDFLKKNPREQYASLRIAEIYEKDLHNLLAAALEYEELLKQKLPAERWGWAAVHLCNLYSKLGQQDKTKDLLQRLADDYPQTAAAKKARSRLGLPEPESEPEPEATGQTEDIEMISEPGKSVRFSAKQSAPDLPGPPPSPPKSNLPPGFRPKT
jgi:TolA-binding protein